jgi:NAD kinase
MKFKLFLHPTRPKIGINYVQKLVKDLDLTWSSKEPDIAIIVGGDGTFGYYARRLMIPMLFVGVSDPNPLGSKARLAEIFLENLKGSIKRLQKRQYYIKRMRLLDVSFKK